jgi:hypothetical protein
MAITREDINKYFSVAISLPGGSILSEEGFLALAEWSERQGWWSDFVEFHRLGTDWRASSMGDPYNFAISLFSFLRQRGYTEAKWVKQRNT